MLTARHLTPDGGNWQKHQGPAAGLRAITGVRNNCRIGFALANQSVR